jgi:hypothetical protein
MLRAHIYAAAPDQPKECDAGTLSRALDLQTSTIWASPRAGVLLTHLSGVAARPHGGGPAVSRLTISMTVFFDRPMLRPISR